MAKKAAATKKKLPPAPLGGAARVEKVKKNPLMEKKHRNFRIGGDIQPKRDLTRFVKWPQYIRLQRQKRILLNRIKVPPSIAQFSHTIDKNTFAQVARLLKKYQPETRKQKQIRLREKAAAIEKGQAVDTKCPPLIKFGINHVVDLIENKKAKLVLIAHDVDPVELVCFLPALCRKKDIPFMIVKSKSRLAKFVNMKTATAVALTQVNKEDEKELQTLTENAMASFNNNVELRRTWGGGLKGVKSLHIENRRLAILEKEQAKKTGLIVA